MKPSPQSISYSNVSDNAKPLSVNVTVGNVKGDVEVGTSGGDIEAARQAVKDQPGENYTKALAAGDADMTPFFKLRCCPPASSQASCATSRAWGEFRKASTC